MQLFKLNRKKGFTLIELIVVIAIIAIFVLLAVPKYLNYTKEAQLTKVKVNIKELEQASQKYYMTNSKWPRLTADSYSAEQLEEYAKKIYDKTGGEIVLEEGNYYDIDYAKIDNYVKSPDDKANYILKNPVGAVFYLAELSEEGYARVDYGQESEKVPNLDYIPIYTASELESIGKDEKFPLYGNYKLINDIDLGSYSNWTPLGEFRGI